MAVCEFIQHGSNFPMKYMRSFPMSAYWVDDDVPDSDVGVLQNWLAENRRSIVIPAVNKAAAGSIAQAAMQERLKPENVSYYASVPTSDQELLCDHEAIIQKLTEEIELASCLGAKYFIFQRTGKLADSDLMSFCRLISEASPLDCAMSRNQLVIKCDLAVDWELWKCISKVMPNVRLCLALSSDYSWLDDANFEKLMIRWAAEQITMISCDLSSIKLNQTGQPSMSKRNREVVLNLGIARNAMIVFQVDRLDGGAEGADALELEASDVSSSAILKTLPRGWTYVRKMQLWLEYIHHKYCEVTRDEAVRIVYNDVLQEPLQPLGSNLSLQQYAVFEEDEVKYAMYKAAIKETLLPLLNGPEPESVEVSDGVSGVESSKDVLSGLKHKYLHIAYLGGGRGPLFDKCFEVLREDGWTPCGDHKISKADRLVEVHFSLVEKNPAALMILRANLARRPDADWWSDVALIEKDMRDWTPDVPVALAISELLGSIGDNELAPECMLSKCVDEDTILIPLSSTSYFQPITSEKLFSSSRANRDTGYVCNMITFAPLSSVLASGFAFNYAKTGELPKQNHYARLQWTASQDNWFHGLAGYFEAELSDNITLSICPGRETAGLHSWYPMYLPIDEAIWCHAGDKIQVDIWRRSDSRRVWYEWIASVKSGNHARRTSRIHNINGRGWSIHK